MLKSLAYNALKIRESFFKDSVGHLRLARAYRDAMEAMMETQGSPKILVKRAQKGERDAFDDLVIIYRPELEKHARRRIGDHLRSRVEIEDVIQETFTRAWKSIGNFRWTAERAFLGWLKGTAEHVILKLVSRHSRDRIIYREEDRGSDEPTPSKALRREERFDRLEEALSRLSPDYREAVRLVRLEGLQVKEAARRMNRSPKSVMHLVSRGLRQLKEYFGDTESLHLPPKPLQPNGGEDDSI